MAGLIGGFLKQTCVWWYPELSQSGEPAYDDYGQPLLTSENIKCRWEDKAGWGKGIMGDGELSYRSRIFLTAAVKAGHKLAYRDGAPQTVLAIETIVNIAGKEEGRICYV